MTNNKPEFIRENIYRLSTIRTSKGLTRKDLSRSVGMPEYLIRGYEEGYRSPSRKNYNKLADFFDWQVWEK